MNFKKRKERKYKIIIKSFNCIKNEITKDLMRKKEKTRDIKGNSIEYTVAKQFI